MSGELSWRHHVIIQALLSRGPLKEKDFHSMFEDLTKKNPGTDRQLFDGFVLKINRALTCINFELRGCIDQYDGQVYYGVVNTVSDEQSKLGTKYTVPQIAFYKAIIEALVQDATANGVISSIAALNLNLDSQVTIVTDPQSQESQPRVPPALKNFCFSQKEKTLHELVRDQWLNVTADGDIKLGVKSFLDLRNWFRNNDVPSCQVCNEAGIKAELCENENCAVRIHHHCLKQLFSQRKVAKGCPSCGTSWRCTVIKAEAVQTEDDNEPRGSQRATGSNGNRRRANRIVEDEEAVQTEDDNEPRGSQRATGSNGKRRRANSIVEDEEAVQIEDDNEPRGSQRATGSNGKRRRANSIVEDEEAVQTEDDNEPRGSQRATGSIGKRHRANRIVEDEEVGCSNQGELSQHGNGLTRKRSRARRTNDANIGGPSTSKTSSAIPALRRVTRSSAGLM